MTPAAFASALDALDLSQVQFARLAGVTNGTVSRWVRGVLPVPLWAERLLDAWAVAGVPDPTTDAT
jgi:DNA-binding transcriptional regulator YiaG